MASTQVTSSKSQFAVLLFLRCHSNSLNPPTGINLLFIHLNGFHSSKPYRNAHNNKMIYQSCISAPLFILSTRTRTHPNRQTQRTLLISLDVDGTQRHSHALYIHIIHGPSSLVYLLCTHTVHAPQTNKKKTQKERKSSNNNIFLWIIASCSTHCCLSQSKQINTGPHTHTHTQYGLLCIGWWWGGGRQPLQY